MTQLRIAKDSKIDDYENQIKSLTTQNEQLVEQYVQSKASGRSDKEKLELVRQQFAQT